MLFGEKWTITDVETSGKSRNFDSFDKKESINSGLGMSRTEKLMFFMII